jgi:DNA sulfur modification protein DndD
MLLKKLILENYGLYAGKVEFDLAPRSSKPKERPVVLFGGKNGAGKTTFLEALRLTLYGKSFFSNKASKAEYENFLIEKIHNSNHAVLPLDFARIAIEFDYVTLGEQVTYYVERSWKIKSDSKGVKETLQIFIDGQPEENVTEEYWKGFIEGIIPERLAQLFFFDGEKIRDIASDDDGNRILADSIKSLLGLDLVEKLKADLTIYKNRELKKNSIAEDKKKWALIENEISRLKGDIDQCLTEDLPSVRTELDGKLAEIRKREKNLHTEGNLFATRRDLIKRERNDLLLKIENLENTIREECEKTFPFSLCPTISANLLKQIEIEKKLEHLTIIGSEIHGFKNDIIKVTETFQSLDHNTRENLKRAIELLARPRTELPEQLKDADIILGLTEAAATHIKTSLEYAEQQSKKTVQKLSSKLQEETQRLRLATLEIAKIPEDEQIKPIFEELSILNQERGELQQEEKRLLKKIDSLTDDLKKQQKELTKLIERQKSQSRLALVDKAHLVLDDYLKKLTISKTEQLKKSVAEAFNCLSRKGDLLERVEIDPQSFGVTLFDHAGNAIPKERLSSGEKQLYAVAMLWGLAKTSGRPLPVIVDTPLGRLDSDHRTNLITNYFPEASHQVVLLSTDTEVDQGLFAELMPHISHCYHLEFDPITKSTNVKEEYFWPETSTCLN